MSGSRSANPFRSRSSEAEATTPGEEVLLLHIGLAVLVGLLGSAGLLWAQGTAWLVRHHVLIAAARHPLVPIAGSGGAGLDLPRLVIASAVVVAVLAATVTWRR
jgi:hypothetical protein